MQIMLENLECSCFVPSFWNVLYVRAWVVLFWDRTKSCSIQKLRQTWYYLTGWDHSVIEAKAGFYLVQWQDRIINCHSFDGYFATKYKNICLTLLFQIMQGQSLKFHKRWCTIKINPMKYWQSMHISSPVERNQKAVICSTSSVIESKWMIYMM